MPFSLPMNASAYPFYPAYSAQYGGNSTSSPSSPIDGAMDLSRLSYPSPNGSFDHSRRSTPIQRLSTPTYYHTMPQPSSSSSHSSSQHSSIAAVDRRSAVQLHDYTAEVPGVLLPHFQPHKRSTSSSQHLSNIIHHSHHLSTDSTASALSSALSSSTYPLHSPQSSPPYSPRDDFSPPHVPTSVKYGTAPALGIIYDREAQDRHDRHDGRTRRLSDSPLTFSSLPSPFPSTPFPNISSILHPLGGAPAASLVDPRAHDPERLHALISVVFHMEHTGQQQKFLSQLGILYKQLYPHLFVKGMLKDLVDHAVLSGLLKLTGPAGQQQVHLTHKARANAMSYVNIPALANPFGLSHVTNYHTHTPSAHSPSPAPSPSSSPAPVSQNSTDDDEHSGTRSRSGSSGSGSGSGRHTRNHSVQNLHSARATPNSSPMGMPTAAPSNSLPALTIGASSHTYTPPSSAAALSGPATPPTFSSSSYPSFFATLAATVPYTPTAPATFILEEKYFKHEKPRHLTYMFHFRVHACKAFVNKACPVATGDGSKGKGRGGDGGGGGSSDCFDYHSASKTRRRVPRIVSYSNGTFWNYNACRCQAIEKEIKCEKGDACRYSHNKEEIAYHPSRYKTQPCSYPARADGVCTRFGIHCAYAHGEDDIRKPIVLKQGMPHKLVQSNESHYDSLQLVGAGLLMPSVSAGEAAQMSRRMSLNGLEDDFPTTAETAGDSYFSPDDYITPKDCLASDRAFFLYNYATKPCTESSSACANNMCANYHYDNKRRRHPKLYKYSAEPCVNVRPDGLAQWKRPSCCPLGDSCGSAHTLLECMYHPSIYKTQLCSKFDERDPSTWKRCQWGRLCAHAHSRSELEYNEQCMRLAANDAGATSASVPHIVYDYEDNAPAEKLAPTPYYSKSLSRESKPPLPPNRSGVSGVGSNHSSPLSSHTSLTSPAAISALWSKPASNGNSPSSSSSSPAPSIRIPNPIQPRMLTPINSELTSYFTPLGPTVLRDEDEEADESDSIIVKPTHHHFTASSSSTSSPAPSAFVSPLHSWQSTPSGRATPSSQQPYGAADELEPRFDSSFLDSAVPAAATSTGPSSPSSGSSTDMSHLRALLNEESERSAELRAENAALKQQLAAFASQLAAMNDKMNEMDRRASEHAANTVTDATADDKPVVVRVMDDTTKDGAGTSA